MSTETEEQERLSHAIVGQPPSYVRNCVTMGRGERLFLYHVDGTLLPTLDGYAIIPVGHYFDLLGVPLPESLSQYQEDVQACSRERIRTLLSGCRGPSVELGVRLGKLVPEKHRAGLDSRLRKQS